MATETTGFGLNLIGAREIRRIHLEPRFTGVANKPTTGLLTGKPEVTGAAIEVRR
jgi:hypothetical protein